MDRARAIKIAIEALEAEIARVQIDADLYDKSSLPQPGELGVANFRTPWRAAASKRRQECRAAIEVLQQSEPVQMRML